MFPKKFIYFLSGLKGLLVLKELVQSKTRPIFVYIDIDKNLENDSSQEIFELCARNYVQCEYFHDQISFLEFDSSRCVAIAVGWRKLIKNLQFPLIVMHDSLLPKYRGFAPTVAQLINNEDQLGVTAFFASPEYDCGDIIVSKSVDITYPCTIRQAISLIALCYCQCIEWIYNSLEDSEELTTIPQETLGTPTYTIWRDQYDYFIDWSLPAIKILATINALGSPYQGAQTMASGIRIVVHTAQLFSDTIQLEQVHFGKVFKLINALPVVICGDGNLIHVLKMSKFDDNSEFYLTKIRTRFYKPSYDCFLHL